MHFFFDLDGPLLDVSEKYYRTYADLLAGAAQKTLNKDLYWELKRNKTPESEIHALTSASVKDYKSSRKNIIETDAYQLMDTLQPSALEVLQQAKNAGTVFLVTLRHSREQLEKQLKRLGLYGFFDVVLSSGAETEPRWKIKEELLLQHFGGCPPELSIFIGDTETDILAGQSLGSKTVAVLNGIRNYDKLKQVRPDFLIPSVDMFPELNLF